MQVKPNEHKPGVEPVAETQSAAHAHKVDPTAEANKTKDVDKQASAQQDRAKQWDKFAAHPAASVQAASHAHEVKKIEANEALAKADIEAKLRENGIKA